MFLLNNDNDIVTAKQAYERLKALEGHSLLEIAKYQYCEDGRFFDEETFKRDKGRFGKIVEREATGRSLSRDVTDGFNYEIKTTVYSPRAIREFANWYSPKESLYIANYRKDDFLSTNFLNSKCLKKIQNMILLIRSYEGVNSSDSTVLKVIRYNIDEDFEIIKNDYEDIQNVEDAFGYDGLSGYGNYLQSRTKGKKDSITRALYFKRKYLERICPPFVF